MEIFNNILRFFLYTYNSFLNKSYFAIFINIDGLAAYDFFFNLLHLGLAWITLVFSLFPYFNSFNYSQITWSSLSLYWHRRFSYYCYFHSDIFCYPGPRRQDWFGQITSQSKS